MSDIYSHCYKVSYTRKVCDSINLQKLSCVADDNTSKSHLSSFVRLGYHNGSWQNILLGRIRVCGSGASSSDNGTILFLFLQV